jgi:hypothetical protein
MIQRGSGVVPGAGLGRTQQTPPPLMRK